MQTTLDALEALDKWRGREGVLLAKLSIHSFKVRLSYGCLEDASTCMMLLAVLPIRAPSPYESSHLTEEPMSVLAGSILREGKVVVGSLAVASLALVSSRRVLRSLSLSPTSCDTNS